MKATAAVLREINKPLELVSIEIPELERGQVLVEFYYSGVCRSQLMEVRGLRGEDNWLPHLLGHEGVGVVRDIGIDVSTVNIGDVVVVGWLETNGVDANPAFYINPANQEKINSGKAVTFATAAVVSENRIFLKPNNIGNKVAVLLGCALPTGAGMVLNETEPKNEDKILIIGLGGIGLSVLVTLLMKGLDNISVIDPNIEKLKLAKKMGVKGLLKQDTNELKLKNYFDICYEASGQIAGIENGFSIIKKSGTLIFASHPPDGQKIRLEPHQLIQGKKIVGSWGGGGQPEKTAQSIEKLGHVHYLEYLLGKEYTIFDINTALADLENGKSLRPIIKMIS